AELEFPQRPAGVGELLDRNGRVEQTVCSDVLGAAAHYYRDELGDRGERDGCSDSDLEHERGPERDLHHGAADRALDGRRHGFYQPGGQCRRPDGRGANEEPGGSLRDQWSAQSILRFDLLHDHGSIRGHPDLQPGRSFQVTADGALIATVTASAQGTISFTT